MKPYLLSLASGVLAGIVYSVINVHSPAPPTIALIGLLGMLAGEQIIPVTKKMLSGSAFHAAWRESKCSQHMFGPLPGRNMPEPAPPADAASSGDRSR